MKFRKSGEISPRLVSEGASALQYQPGFTLYLGIDGHKLFSSIHEPEGLQRPPNDKVTPYGFSALPLHESRNSKSNATFVDGRQPTWKEATDGNWPWLDSTRELHTSIDRVLASVGGRGVVALGPMGEGKTSALMQVAHHIATTTDWTVLWREPGAPPMDSEWFTRVRAMYDKVLVCVDDADLVTAELLASKDVWGTGSSKVALLLASQDRLWVRHAGSFRKLVKSVQFHNLSENDAYAIATAWDKHDLLPKSGSNEGDPGVSAVAEKLFDSSQAMLDGQQTTLFGAVLDVRYGSMLADRIRDLLQKFRNIKVRSVRDVTLADVFEAICLIQDTYDKYGQLGRGASRPLVAALVGLEAVFVDGKILELLGREAAVTYAADRIYSRHPAIAKAVVDLLRLDGSISDTARLVGRAGASLRAAGGLYDYDYRDAYLIAKALDSADEAIAAAEGALTAAPELLEPRVTYLSVLRKHKLGSAMQYATALAKHVRGYKDFGGAIRALLVESSQVASCGGAEQLAVGLAALALHDGIGFHLDERRAQYGLVRLAKSASSLHVQSPSAASDVVTGAAVVLERLIGVDNAWKYLSPLRKSELDEELERTRRLAASSLCHRITSGCSRHARSALVTIGLDAEDVAARISLVDLQRLITAKRS